MPFRIFTFFVFILSSTHALAQERIKFVGIETGANFLDSETAPNDRIRASFSDYYNDGFGMSNTLASLDRLYAGVKFEVRSRNNFLGLAIGLRYSQVSNSIEESYGPGFFYYLFRETETTTEFARINKISQRTSYVSVPIELRVFTYRERTFRLYFLLGTEIGFKAASNTDVRFYDESMNVYESEIEETIMDTGNFYSTFCGRGGFIIGKGKSKFDVSIAAPFVISHSAAKLVEPGVGGGIHFQIIKPF